MYWAGAGNAAESHGLLTISSLAFPQSETGSREVAMLYLGVKGTTLAAVMGMDCRGQG